MKNKKSLYLLLLIPLAVIVYWGTTNILGQNSKPTEEQLRAQMPETKPDGGQLIQIEEETTEEIETQWKTNMSETAIQTNLHHMSHQKIIATEKWGAIPLTEQRVNRLLEIVEQNEQNYQHADLYKQILTRWSENDFTRIDLDHNVIWKLQGGSIGEAIGIATPEQEQTFIDERF